MNILARFLPEIATWGLILAAIVIGVVLYVGRGKIDPGVRMALLVILFVLVGVWIFNMLPIGDTKLP